VQDLQHCGYGFENSRCVAHLITSTYTLAVRNLSMLKVNEQKGA
jgi:hypothetical protein